MKKSLIGLCVLGSISSFAGAISKLPNLEENKLVPGRWYDNYLYKDSAILFEDNLDRPKSIKSKTCRYYLKQYDGEYNSEFENTIVKNLRSNGLQFAGRYEDQILKDGDIIVEWDYLKNNLGKYRVGTQFRTYNTPSYDSFFRLMKKVRIYMGAGLNQYAPDFYMEETAFAGAGIAYHVNKTLAFVQQSTAYSNSYAHTNSIEELDKKIFQYLPSCLKIVD